MTRLFALAFGCAIVAATPVIAASPFDGTWKIDIRTSKTTGKPDTFLLKDGVFSCSTCNPPVSVKADGMVHEVTGHDYSDAIKIEIIDAHSIKRTFMLHGKVVGTGTVTVSPDGRTLYSDYSMINAATGVPISGKGTETRIGKVPDGAHPISGSWHPEALEQLSDTGSNMTLKVVGDTLTMTSPDGTAYTAKFGGPAVVQQGDVAHTMIRLAKPAPNTIVETDSRGGKVVDVYTMALSPDGKTLRITNDDKKGGEISKSIAKKL